MHADAPLGLSIYHRCDHGRARTGARRFSFADAALPQTLFNVAAIANTNEDYVGALGKLRMIFGQRAEAPPVDFVEIVNENAAVGVAHLQRRDPHRFITYLKRVINHAIARLVCQHRNRSTIEPGLAEFRLKYKSTFADSLSQMVTLDAVARTQPQLIVRPEIVKEQICRGASRAVAGHAGFTSVGIEDANLKVRIAVFRRLGYRNAV